MIRLLLASELLGLLCSHIDWTAPIQTGSLRSQEIRARPEAVYSGFREVSDKRGWVGRGEEQRRHFSPGSKAPAAAATAAAASLSSRGVF